LPRGEEGEEAEELRFCGEGEGGAPGDDEEAWQIRHRARFATEEAVPTALPFISIGGLTGR